MVSFILKTSTPPNFNIYHDTAMNPILLPICIIGVLNNYFLVTIMSRKNMSSKRPNVESKRLTHGDEWATTTIVFPRS